MLKQHCYLATIILAAIALSAPALNPKLPALAAKIEKGEEVSVVCFGDSVTGIYYHTGGRRAYTDMLQIALEQRFPGVAFNAINAGVSGHTTVNALERIETDVLAKKPDLVTVMFGLNDMTRVSLEDYRANLKSIVAQCREIGAEVLLCTPNNVEDTEGRPTDKLLQYCAVVREVAAEENVALGDCYNHFEAIRQKSAEDWWLHMSDEIHPNMDGHEEIARCMASAIVGRELEKLSVPAPQPAIPHTLALIRAKQPITVLAMPPYDAILGKLIAEVAQESTLTVTTWDVTGMSMEAIEESAKAVREQRPDLAFIAVPADAASPDFDDFKRHFTWIMNFSLSFKLQEWDVIAVPPSFTGVLDDTTKARDAWARRLIQAQDFELIDGGGSTEAAEAAIRAWLMKQLEQ